MEYKDKLYLHRCIQLANRAAGNNAPNPRVGSVVVCKDVVIGEGYHQKYGEGHAEVNAIASISEQNKHLLAQSTIYVTLEPCFHYGKTPPCVDLILKHKIPRVVIACTDPFEKVAGQSIQKLKEHGVEVLVGVLEKEAAWLTRRFFTTVQQKRPYIVLKYAQSKDGFIGREGEEVAISNALSKRLVHQWRSEETAILVGTNTALVDNPQLNNRLWFGKSPLRLVLDKNLRLPNSLYLFDGTLETWVFTEKQENSTRKNVRFVPISFDDNLLKNMLNYLQEQRIQSVLVEGGQQLLQTFIDQNLWDEARVLTSNQYLKNGIKAPILPKHLLKSTQQLADNRIEFFTNDY